MTSRIVAITGGIGSGKSEVVKILQSIGYSTVDCDVLARQVAFDPDVVRQVGLLLGNEYIVDGQLARKKIRDTVFKSESLLEKYNAIFYDKIKDALCNRIAELNESSVVNNGINGLYSNCIFVEIPVFDAFEFDWDEVWLIVSDAETRIKRAQARDGSPCSTLEQIVLRQKICDNYSLKIFNDGSLDDLKNKIIGILKMNQDA